jgi:hypothetical membrane protein
MYSIYLLASRRNVVHCTAAAISLLASVSLMLVGIFHEGYITHADISVTFFMTAYLYVLRYGTVFRYKMELLMEQKSQVR